MNAFSRIFQHRLKPPPPCSPPVTAKTGAKNLLYELYKIHLKYQSSQAYEAYETFENFMWRLGLSISDYVIKFEQLYFKAKSFHMEIQDEVLTYRLLNSANLTSEQKQIVKATVSKMKYQDMKDLLKKVFSSTTSDKKEDFKTEIKIEESDVLLLKEIL